MKEEANAANVRRYPLSHRVKGRENRSLRPGIDLGIAKKKVDMFTRRQAARQQTLQCGELSHN